MFPVSMGNELPLPLRRFLFGSAKIGSRLRYCSHAFSTFMIIQWETPYPTALRALGTVGMGRVPPTDIIKQPFGVIS